MAEAVCRAEVGLKSWPPLPIQGSGAAMTGIPMPSPNTMQEGGTDGDRKYREEKDPKRLRGHGRGARTKEGRGGGYLKKNRTQSCSMFDGNPKTRHPKGQQTQRKRQDENYIIITYSAPARENL